MTPGDTSFKRPAPDLSQPPKKCSQAAALSTVLSQKLFYFYRHSMGYAVPGRGASLRLQECVNTILWTGGIGKTGGHNHRRLYSNASSGEHTGTPEPLSFTFFPTGLCL